MINLIKNKDLIEDIFDYDVILVGSGIKNVKGNGFHRKVFINFPFVEETNNETNPGDIRKLGTVRISSSPLLKNPIFALCYITKGRYRPDLYPDTLDYNALEECLKLISRNFEKSKIAGTILGNSDLEAGGDKERILELFHKYCENLDITLYDYEQKDYEQENAEEWHSIKNLIGKIPKEEYYDRKKRLIWKETFGIYKPVPEDMSYQEVKSYIKDFKKNK